VHDSPMLAKARTPSVVPDGSEHGLICGFCLCTDGSSTPVKVTEVAGMLAAEAGGQVIWLHFNASNAAARRWLVQSRLVSRDFLDLLEQHETRAQATGTGDALVAVVPDLAFGERVDPSEVVTVWAYASAPLLVTARNHAAQTADLLRQSARGRLAASSGQALLAHLLEVQGDMLRGWLGRATDALDHAEDQILIGKVARQRAELGRTRRLAMHLRRNFAPMRMVLQRLLSQTEERRGGVDVAAWRALQDDLAFTVDEAAGVYERAKLLQEELSSRLAEATGQNLFVLTVTTIVFLPMTLLTGVFGMNIDGVPGVGEGASDRAFWWVVLLIAAAGLATWLVIRRLRRT
jgi:zinc transporter